MFRPRPAGLPGLARFIAVAALAIAAADAQPSPLTPQTLPKWLREEGLVMAGNWESLSYRLRAGNLIDPGDDVASAEKIARFKSAYTEATARRLKDAGVNFVMIPLAKGFGPHHELEQRELSRNFAAICHRLGLHVGVYISGTMFYESMKDEYPDADDWCIREPDGQFAYYNWSDTRMYYRRPINRDHPTARAYYREMIRIAIQDIHADLIHLDNYGHAPGYEAYSVKRFREFLAKKYTPEQRHWRFGFDSVDHIEPPIPPGPGAPASFTNSIHDPLLRDFIDYRAAVLAKVYRDMGDYARSLNPDVMLECNPGGYRRNLDASRLPGNDHLRLLAGGNAFWDEGKPSALQPNGVLMARFRSELLGRHFNNLVFDYTSEPVSMAEAMALGLQCVGCPIFFVNGEIGPHENANSPTLDPATYDYIRFFHAQQALYRDAKLVADVAVLNSFGDNALAPRDARKRASTVEQSIYQGKVPFTLLPVDDPGDLQRFRAIVVADMYYVPDALQKKLHEYVRNGGGLVLTDRVGAFSDLFPKAPGHTAQRASAGKGRVAFVPKVELPEVFGKTAVNHQEILDAISWAAGGQLSARVDAPLTTTMALYQQAGGRRVLHLVNYDTTHPETNVPVSVAGAVRSATLYSPDDSGSTELHLTAGNGETSFQVPHLKTYAVIVLEE